MKPLAIDLFCGLGGWTDGLLAEGWRVVGFDIEPHDYGTGGYPGQLVLQDVRTIHGSQFRHADLIVASPPCQEFSYMAMPWKRAKQIAAALRGQGDFPAGYRGSRTIAELTALFDACFRIQREASEAATLERGCRRCGVYHPATKLDGCAFKPWYIPLIVENVKGAQPWVGRAPWNYGSYYLWGDVPALMPFTGKNLKGFGGTWFHNGELGTINPNRNRVVPDAIKNSGGSWFNIGSPGQSKSASRKAASAAIAEIPYALAAHIARVFKPADREAVA